METLLESLAETLNKLGGAPASILVLFACVIAGYVLRCVRRFPNEAIPVAVILVGGLIYPFVADDNNDFTLRVWVIRNSIIGLTIGFIAWTVHNKILKKVEERLGLFCDDSEMADKVSQAK